MPRIFVIAASLGLVLASGAYAQSTPPTPAPDPARELQRNVNQQQRIENGLQSGGLTTGEAARLEKGEARIDRMESNALKDGSLSPNEAKRITRAQNEESRAIYRADHNARTGNPDSASSKRMQADVQRNVNQQKRIQEGAASGSLSNKETASLERGQARVSRKEARAGANGRVNAREQHRIQSAENRQSHRIRHEKHD